MARVSRYIQSMPHTFLQCDFGANEEAAQKAKQTVDRWKQAFRLDKKLLLKFARGDAKKSGPENGGISLIIRLDFSDHERLSYQRWLDRIPGEDVFKSAQPKVIRSGDADFAAMSEKFDELE